MPPIASYLRGAVPDRWLRVHTLPESKRYPETSAEASEVLFRQNALGNRLLGPGSACFLISYKQEGVKEVPRRKISGPLRDASRQPWMRLPADEHREPDTIVFGIEALWRSGDFNQHLLAIADGTLQAMWIALEDGAVFAPYDGGIDLIYPTTAARDFDRGHFASWLSRHPAGL